MKSQNLRLFLVLVSSLSLAATAFAGGDKKRPNKQKKRPMPQQRQIPNQPMDQTADDAVQRGAAEGGIATPSAVHAKEAADIHIGKPIKFHNISVLPVISKRKGPFQSYTLLEEGIARKTFAVRELDGNSNEAQVNSIEVRNRGKEPVYLLGGEMILGGKQDRIIARDTVVAANGKWLKVDVFCVEQGRWRGQNMKFSAGKAVADVAVTRAAMSGNQSKVWSEVSKKNVFHGTQSSTQTYRRTIQNADLRKKIRPYVKELKSRLPADRMLAGMIFGVNGKIHVADIFGNPVLFQDLNDKLLSAYVLEALSHQVDKNARPVTYRAAKSFVSKGRKSKAKNAKNAGMAKSYAKESDDFIGAETVDEDGETVRETYLSK